ncbi:MAG TPA: nucleotide exchange factor GrpE [Candidatus Binataceae bacterium]|nr:nucleotide exchange factor GrpE [Candidatus Binataceae bacterium]
MSKHHHHKEDGEAHLADPASAETSSGAESLEALEGKLAEKDKEIAELKDKYLRALADGENARKRIRQQSEESVRIQKEELIRDLLPIVDNLERAVGAARGAGSDGQIVQGVEMVLRSLHDFLKSQSVTPIQSVGQLFDPARHEAVDYVASSAHRPNTVVEESHRGYQIGERILRPARVTVAKGVDGERNNGESDSSDVENN